MFIRNYFKQTIFFCAFLAIIFSVFFYKTVIFHKVPFPGDLLLSSAPFKTESYFGYAPGGYPNKGQGRDVITELYPWKYESISQMKQGQIPFWNPYNFSGNILMQNYQSGVLYPINILFFILPFNVAWVIFILLQPILAMIFMYILLRGFRLEKVSSFLGAVAFAFSSYMTVWLEWGNIGHAFLWLPIMLFACFKLSQKVQIRWFILLTFATTCSLLAGYIQGAFYTIVATLLFAIFAFLKTKNHKQFALAAIIVALINSICIAAIVLLPTFAFLYDSSRGSYSLVQIQNLLNPWYYLVTLFASDFFGNPATRSYVLPITYFERVMYVGIPILFFALYAITQVKTGVVRFFGFISVIVILLTTNFPGISYFYLLPIPVLSTTVPTRLLSVFIFCVIVLAAFGIDAWMKEKKWKLKIPILFIVAYIILWSIVVLVPKIYPSVSSVLINSKHNLLLPILFALATIGGFFIKFKWKRVGIGIICLIVIIDLFYGFQKFTPFVPMELIFPKTPVETYMQQNAGINRYWGYGFANVPANYETVFGTYGTDGYDPLFIKSYGELLSTSGNGKISFLNARTDANIAKAYGISDFKTNLYRQKILNLLGVKYILHIPDATLKPFEFDESIFEKSNYTLVWEKKPSQIYENKNAFPRYFLTPFFVVKKNNKDILNAIFTTDIRKILILSESPKITPDPKAKGIVSLLKYNPEEVEFSVNSTGVQFLFLSDTYYKDWHVEVDGREQHLYKADYALRAVEVPKGQHVVKFFYRSESFILGLYIASAGVLIGLGYVFYLLRRSRS